MSYFSDNSSKEFVTTADGFLTISTRAQKAFWKEWDPEKMIFIEKSKNYTSGMIQSWNKFCFTGGVIEISVQMPGNRANTSGKFSHGTSDILCNNCLD